MMGQSKSGGLIGSAQVLGTRIDAARNDWSSFLARGREHLATFHAALTYVGGDAEPCLSRRAKVLLGGARARCRAGGRCVRRCLAGDVLSQPASEALPPAGERLSIRGVRQLASRAAHHGRVQLSVAWQRMYAGQRDARRSRAPGFCWRAHVDAVVRLHGRRAPIRIARCAQGRRVGRRTRSGRTFAEAT